MKNTKGVILCGGYGAALKPLTDDIPMALIEIKDNYTIVDKQLIDFRNAGITDVTLVISYLGNQIKERYKKEYKGVKISYIEEEKPEGTLKAIKRVLKDCDHDMVVRNGDIVTDINLKKFILSSQQTKFPVTIFITRLPSPYGVVETDAEKITSFKEKPLLEHSINAGIYFFKKIFAPPEMYKKGNIGSAVFPELVKRGKVGYYKENVFWRAVDTIKDVKEIRKEYRSKKDKPWGYEKILINTEEYLTKELYLREGYRTSLHRHDQKDETMYIVRGRGYIQFENEKKHFTVNDTLRIKPNVLHSIVALENTIIHEVSTPHLNDTIRIKDYYSRG
ncbi:MAG: sugar phosphate nucleotidyltransferase [Euryarchaeota archaeon]|nr:sugar phosphate nucleotidyltransferase [Euryarchaeota archaeon]